jgi:hypothetical protein
MHRSAFSYVEKSALFFSFSPPKAATRASQSRSGKARGVSFSFVCVYECAAAKEEMRATCPFLLFRSVLALFVRHVGKKELHKRRALTEEHTDIYITELKQRESNKQIMKVTLLSRRIVMYRVRG